LLLGTTLLVVCPLSAAQTRPGTSASSGPISDRDAVATADPTRAGVDPRISEAHELYWDLQVMESLQLFEDVVDDAPESYEALWAAARSAIAEGLLSRGREVQNQWFQIGESYARRATELEPEGLVGLYWLLSAKGLRAAQTGGRDASALGGEVFDLAHQVLEMDSLHAGAHHALGVLNYRVRKLSSIERFVARNFLGGDVMNSTTWEDAERYLNRAVELNPEYILFHLDLGRMLLDRNRKDEARIHLQRVLELPVVEPPDTRFQMVAERRLAETLD
jgi:tetratricopeptide (TPR) repeat protein